MMTKYNNSFKKNKTIYKKFPHNEGIYNSSFFKGTFTIKNPCIGVFETEDKSMKKILCQYNFVFPKLENDMTFYCLKKGHNDFGFDNLEQDCIIVGPNENLQLV